jgi:hypothetical protein
VFGPALREHGKDRMVYSTSVGFRVVFLGTALVILLSIASASEGPFLARFGPASLIVAGICLFAALYLQRWTFDKKANQFERHVGIIFFYERKKVPLGALAKVILREPGGEYRARRALLRWTSRRIVMLSVEDRDSRVYRLDIARGGSVHAVRRSAQRLSAFCGIPLEDDTMGADE